MSEMASVFSVTKSKSRGRDETEVRMEPKPAKEGKMDSDEAAGGSRAVSQNAGRAMLEETVRGSTGLTQAGASSGLRTWKGNRDPWFGTPGRAPVQVAKVVRKIFERVSEP